MSSILIQTYKCPSCKGEGCKKTRFEGKVVCFTCLGTGWATDHAIRALQAARERKIDALSEGSYLNDRL